MNTLQESIWKSIFGVDIGTIPILLPEFDEYTVFTNHAAPPDFSFPLEMIKDYLFIIQETNGIISGIECSKFIHLFKYNSGISEDISNIIIPCITRYNEPFLLMVKTENLHDPEKAILFPEQMADILVIEKNCGRNKMIPKCSIPIRRLFEKMNSGSLDEIMKGCSKNDNNT